MGQTLLMLKGLPGCGKSYYAKEHQLGAGGTGVWKIVNKDALRAMLDSGVWSRKNEEFILETRDILICNALESGYSVIVDDTNFVPKHEQRLRELAGSCSADFKVKEFTKVPLGLCKERDAARPQPVGDAVIQGMYDKYVRPTLPAVASVEPKASVVNDASLPDCYVVDLDGTLCLMNGRGPYEHGKYDTDLPNQPVVDVVKALGQKTHLVFVSGRKEAARLQSLQWLNKHGLGLVAHDGLELYMRADGDNRKDVIVKRELYERHIKGRYNVLAVFDDRAQCVKGWRDLGLTCFAVAEGAF